MLAYPQAGGRCQHEAADRAAPGGREHGGHVAAHRVADERDLAELERVEEVEVVQDVVLDRVDARVVGGGAEPGMVGDDEPEAVRERQQGVEARERPRAVEEDERVALPGAEDRRVDPVDVEALFLVAHVSAPPQPRRAARPPRQPPLPRP